MGEKLSNEPVPVRFGLRKEQNSGRETVDAMDDEGSLSPGLQFRNKQGQGGRRLGAWDGDSGKAGGLVDGHNGIVFVKHDEFP